MTVSYTAEVSTCKGFGCFLKLLFRWQGSIYKLVWPDLFFFLGSYFALSVLYRFFLSPEYQITFAQLAIYCEKQGSLIPVSFVLGFYVSIVVGRWWDQYRTIPWPDGIALFVSASIHGQDEKGRLQRRTIMRYCCLSLTMCFTLISPRVKKRFPTLDHLVDAGLLQESEKKIIEKLNLSVPGYSKSWLPIVWASSIVTRARKEGKIRDDFAVKTLLDELNKFRAQCGLLISYDWISVPLVYTQVVTLAVYSYFLSCVMGRQYLMPDHRENTSHTSSGSSLEELDLIFPVFTTLQFFFYMGWLKVAESLVNPFGDDDDDFEVNWLVDRNLQVSYLIVDEIHHEHPELVRDQYWDEVLPSELPHTVASEQFRDEPPLHSTDKILISREDSEAVSPPLIKLDDLGECLDGRRSSLSQRRAYENAARRERPSSIRSNGSQSTFAGSIGEKMSRAGSINSVFRRFFSSHKEPPVGDPTTVGFTLGSMGVLPQGHNLAEDVIPELDENMTTITSMKLEPRPTVKEIFGRPDSEKSQRRSPIPTSGSIDIPGSSKRPYGLLEIPHSAPPKIVFHPPPKSTSSAVRDDIDMAKVQVDQIGPEGDHDDDNDEVQSDHGGDEMKKLVKRSGFQQKGGSLKEGDDDEDDGSDNPLLTKTGEDEEGNYLL